MAKTKRKPESTAKPKALSKSAPKAKPKTLELATELEQVIAGLRLQSFATDQSAVEAVIDAVVSRFGQGEESELRHFLVDLIETDPNLKELIIQGLRS